MTSDTSSNSLVFNTEPIFTNSGNIVLPLNYLMLLLKIENTYYRYHCADYDIFSSCDFDHHPHILANLKFVEITTNNTFKRMGSHSEFVTELVKNFNEVKIICNCSCVLIGFTRDRTISKKDRHFKRTDLLPTLNYIDSTNINQYIKRLSYTSTQLPHLLLYNNNNILIPDCTYNVETFITLSITSYYEPHPYYSTKSFLVIEILGYKFRLSCDVYYLRKFFPDKISVILKNLHRFENFLQNDDQFYDEVNDLCIYSNIKNDVLESESQATQFFDIIKDLSEFLPSLQITKFNCYGTIIQSIAHVNNLSTKSAKK